MLVLVSQYAVNDFELLLSKQPSEFNNVNVSRVSGGTQLWWIEVIGNDSKVSNVKLQNVYEYVLEWGEHAADNYHANHTDEDGLPELITYTGATTIMEVEPSDAIRLKYH